MTYRAALAERDTRAEKHRTFTRQACGERGWTVACLLPLAAAMGVLLQ